MYTIGLFLIYTGFWGFYAACNIPIISPETIAGQITGTTWTATNIYLAPTTLSAITFNFLMSLSGGMMAGYIVSKGDPFWTFSCGLCGVIATSAGNDLYHPIQAMLIGAIVPVHLLQTALFRRTPVQDRRCGGRCRGARLRRIPRRGRCGLHAVGTAVLSL